MYFYHDGTQDLVLVVSKEEVQYGLPMIELPDDHPISRLVDCENPDLSMIKVDLEKNEIFLVDMNPVEETHDEDSVRWIQAKEFVKTPIEEIEDNGPEYDVLVEHDKKQKKLTVRFIKPFTQETVFYIAENSFRDNLLGTIVLDSGEIEGSFTYDIEGSIVVMSEVFYKSAKFYEIS